jgi:hypothetical protein
VAQCYGESVPVLVLPMGYARRLPISTNFNSNQAMRHSQILQPINVGLKLLAYNGRKPGGRTGARWDRNPADMERGSAGALELHPGAAHPLWPIPCM